MEYDNNDSYEEVSTQSEQTQQYQQYQQAPQYSQTPDSQQQSGKSNGVLGKVALAFSIISVLCCCFPWVSGLISIICAIIALVQAKKEGTTDKCAIAALIITGITVVLYIILIAFGLMDTISSYGGLNNLQQELNNRMNDMSGNM